MGICCSKTAKETGTLSLRHFVSVSSSPSLVPTENKYKQDSVVASHVEETGSRVEKAVETAGVIDYNEKSSRSAVIDNGVDPT